MRLLVGDTPSTPPGPPMRREEAGGGGGGRDSRDEDPIAIRAGPGPATPRAMAKPESPRRAVGESGRQARSDPSGGRARRQ